ncbi:MULTISPECIES: hypothetical protein [Leuconostoc]|uniref:Uncharacterized protein n=2 Tax=Leuconostoc kimchii TaxID=136609 RepID=D5T3E0_LEUKI|nr:MULTISPECIES: hypothetical protein [Leuconostoc]ADG40789.1 hypothetical protein LKI_06245 [Leuconostoc kimchii IMSNU 11154]AEJ31235.1 hypothetical protein LGMK_05890 [Leuconostoc sp. C2]MBM7436418.1 hypothetical protein [Leuconostoc rapi]QBR48321.1 hypothetical protein EW139_09435 [Leuconostoc kimchii]
MFSYYVLPTIYILLLVIFSLLKPERFTITASEFQRVTTKAVLLAILAVTLTTSTLTQVYGFWFNITLFLSLIRVVTRVRQQKK